MYKSCREVWNMKPQPFLHQDASLEEQADMRDLLTSMFIENHREGREMGEEEEEDLSNLVAEEEEEEEEEEAVEAVSDPQEIARFNNYMDAIYRYHQYYLHLRY